MFVTGEVETTASSPAYTLAKRDAEGTRYRLQLSGPESAGDAGAQSTAAADEPGPAWQEVAAADEPGPIWQVVSFTSEPLEGPFYNNVMVLYSDFVVGDCDVQIVES